MQRRLATILVNFNGLNDTLDCIEALRSGGIEPESIFVVDNGSEDSSAILSLGRDQGIQAIISDKNLGFGWACNLGAYEAKKRGFEVLWFLNNDTIVPLKTLNTIKSFEDNFEDEFILGGLIYEYPEIDRLQCVGGGKVDYFFGRSKLMKKIGPIDFISGACMVISTEKFLRLGGFDDSYFMYWEDADLSFRGKLENMTLKVVDNLIVYHKDGASSRKSRESTLRFYRNYTISQITYFSRHSKLPFLPIFMGNSIRVIMRLINRDYQGALVILRELKKYLSLVKS